MSERAAARAAAYRLFAGLFRRPVDDRLLPLLRGIPELGDALSDPFDADDAAAEHHRLFSLQVPPFAGVFLDPEGRIGGAPASLVRELAARAGVELDERSEDADHVAHALELLAALEDEPALEAETIDRTLLPWLPWMVEAVERHASPFHRGVAGLTLELVLDHRGSLDRPAPPAAVATVDDPLADAETGLRRIAAWLVTPARSGLYLARDDVRRVASDRALPTGFGGRADSLETLLRAAAELGGLDAVLAGVRGLVEAGRSACAALERSGVAGADAVAAQRRARLERTADVLARLAAGAAV